MKEETTAEELSAARQGQEPALAAIMARFLPTISFYAGKAVRPGLERDDAVQEGIIGLFHAIESYAPGRGAQFSTYAGVCIQNAIASAQKAAGRQKHAPLNQSIPISDAQSIPGPEEDTIAQERLASVLRKARTSLSPLEKEVLLLRLDGFSYNEIAEKLGRTAKSVENTLQRVRRKLK